MSDDFSMHLCSNPNATYSASLAVKLAKLEAGMTRKASSSTPPPAAQQIAQLPAGMTLDAEKMPDISTSSDPDDVIDEEYLIQAHTHKRQKVLVAEEACTKESEITEERLIQAHTQKRQFFLFDEEAFTREPEGTGIGTKTSELFDVETGTDESSRRKHNRERGHSAWEDRRSKIADLARAVANFHKHGQLETTTPKENRLKELLKDALEKISLLSEKVAALEEIIRTFCQQDAVNQQIFHQLALDLKEAKGLKKIGDKGIKDTGVVELNQQFAQ